jgi:folate-binding protein YgfZ
MNQNWNTLLSNVSQASLNNTDTLPELFLCPLVNKGLINLQGEQSQEYLQGKLTCDMNKLDDNHYLAGAHCDAKGKMWAIIKTFSLADSFFVTGDEAEVEACRAQLQKYGVFAKTTISDVSEQWFTLGLGGQQAASWIQSRWQVEFKGNAADIPHGKILQLRSERFLLVVNNEEAQALLAELEGQVYQYPLWSMLDIQAGVAHLSEQSISQYVPQMLNLQCLDAISFDKGCYAGQEMVARMKYLGKNKRATFILSGNATELPNQGQELQLAAEDNWRRSGALINVAGTAEKFYALAVLPNDMASDAKFRIKDDTDSLLTITPLPYSLDAE